MVTMAAAIAVVVTGALTGGAARVRAAMERVSTPAPDFTCEQCLNHAPFKLSRMLPGKVGAGRLLGVHLHELHPHFSLPAALDPLYRPLGLVIIGVP